MPRHAFTQELIDTYNEEARRASREGNFGFASRNLRAIVDLLEEENQHLYSCLDPILDEARKVGTL